MSAFEQLRPFLRLCQIIGMMPYRMTTDPSTGRISGFSFSFRYLITWWYLLIFIIHTAAICVLTGVTWIALYEEQDHATERLDSDAVTSLVSQMVLYAIFLLARFISLYSTPLRKATQLILQVDTILQPNVNNKCTVKQRFFFGLILALGMVIGLIIGSFELAAKLSTGYGELFLFGSIGIVLAVMFVVFGTSAFLTMHLSYYLVGYYIRSLRLTLAGNGTDGPFTQGWIASSTSMKRTQSLPKIKFGRFVFSLLSQITCDLNQVFWFPALFTIFTLLITSSFSLFVFTRSCLYPDSHTNAVGTTMLYTFLLSTCAIIAIFAAAEEPIREAAMLRDWLGDFSSKQSTVEEHIEVMSFLSVISEDRLRLSTGIFHVGLHLIPTVLGTILTYLIILLETDSSRGVSPPVDYSTSASAIL